MWKALLHLVAVILVALSGPAAAQTDNVGSWMVSTQSDTALYAVTVNDSGALLGQFCYPEQGSCMWLLGMSTGCQEGDKYPVLLNSDRGAQSVEIYCDGKLESGLYRYAFTDFDAMQNHVKDSTRIGFAVPLRADQFRVVRFTLDGATRAIQAMRDAAENKPTRARHGTRDQVL